MDLDQIDPRSIDVGHEVSKLSFRFYSEKEALRLSVRRLTSPFAFDELGRPIPRSLYDPALGPTSYDDGPCQTCGLSYNNCPGHFGHIELPIPIPNPLILKLILKLLRASCWHCQSLRHGRSDLRLLLARLYFEDANLHQCGLTVEAFRGLRKRTVPKLQAGEVELDSTQELAGALVKNWRRFLQNMPEPIAKYVAELDTHDVDNIEEHILRAARAAWSEAYARGTLAEHRSRGWKETERMILNQTGSVCPSCKRDASKTRLGERGRFFRKGSGSEVLLSPTEIEGQIGSLWSNHANIFDLLYGLKGRNIGEEDMCVGHSRFFVRHVLVPPARFRPTSKVGNMTVAAEHPQNLFFQRLLSEIEVIMTANEYGLRGSQEEESNPSSTPKTTAPKPTKARLAVAMSNMQEALRALYDSSGAGSGGSTIQMTGIRQQLEAKAGLLRQHMMGKRVNYSCRSVIGPDAFLDTNEIGIPESFAKLLTIPEPVTPANLEQMQRAVRNGPDKYPGAVAVEDWVPGGGHRLVKFRSSDQTKLLNSQARLLIQNRVQNGNGDFEGPNGADAESDDIAIDKLRQSAGTIPKRVHRHLQTGDLVLFNRQPTLHRVSIMAHKVRVLPGDRTIRFHYANCGSYNADFDGDEMNVHVPQDYLARAEAEELMLSSKHYIVPTSGAPIRGLIQDHIAAATLLSRRDTFLNREDFIQLLYAATERLMLRPEMIRKRYVIPAPAVLMPQRLWTGKQLISSVLAIVANGRPGIHLTASTKTKANIVGDEESQILFREGNLLRGIIDKSSLGSTMYGIVHAVQEAYGSDSSDDFLSAMSRLCVFYMRTHGHTTGVDDLLLNAEGELERSAILRKSVGEIGVSVTNSVYAEMSKGDKGRLGRAKNLIEARRLVEDMIRRDGAEAEDRLDTAMKSALNKVSSGIMKECVPRSLQKAFPGNGFALMTNTGAKGSAVNSAQISCLLGSTVLEGKRVPRMGGSGSTLPCFMPFDASPIAGGFIAGRFLTGISPHEFFFHAMSGREGLLDTSLKTANSGYLQRCLVKHLEGVRLHYDSTVRDSDQSVLQFIYGDDGIDPTKSRWLNEKVEWQVSNEKSLKTFVAHSDDEVLRVRRKRKGARKLLNRSTLLESVSPGALSRRGAVSEKYNEAIEKAIENNSGEERRVNVRQFLEGRYQACALEPGEAVGILAAQGVGEPSTQMTLNTFHHAGSSSAHVTLGIPRLRELLMTASKYPKTPSMTLPIAVNDKDKGAKKLCARLQNINLADLLLSVEIQEEGISFSQTLGEEALRTLKITLHLPPEKVYAKEVGFNFARIQEFIQAGFLMNLHERFKREMTKIKADKYSGEGRAVKMYYMSASKPTFSSGHLQEKADKGAEQGAGDKLPSATEEGADISDDGSSGRGEECASSSDEEDDESDVLDDERVTGASPEVPEQQPARDTLSPDGGDGLPSPPASKKKKRPKRKTDKHADGDGEGARRRLLDALVDSGSLGYVYGSVRGVNKRRVELRWAFPVALIGKLNIAAVTKETAANAKLAQVPRISRCFIDSGAAGSSAVITEGSNIAAILEKGFGLVDFDHLETNDMFGILNYYGVEAMRAALIQEFVKVFDAYGIPVNIRHLRLIADYMTVHGSYRGFNRRSMDSTPSPFQQMTFETSISFLTNAALNSTNDLMKNPSAALAVGQVYEGGTGGFELLQEVA